MPEKNTKRLNWEKYTWIDFERICFEYAKEKYNSTIYKVKITQAQKDGGTDIEFLILKIIDLLGVNASIINEILIFLT